ncbi:MAG: hypothetical protein QXE45_04280, partial [Thermoplasmata archaeon]
MTIDRLMAGILLITLLASSSISADAIIAYDDCAHDLLFVRIQFDDIDDGEFFSICNVGRVAVDLANWSITDGEGDLIFRTGLEIMPMRELTIARSYSSYLRQNGQAPNC